MLCVDEDSGLQALERSYESRLPRPRKPGKYEYESKRHGTIPVLAALDVATGNVISACDPTHTADDLVAFMNTVADSYKRAKQIHVVWDNLNIHYDGKDER